MLLQTISRALHFSCKKKERISNIDFWRSELAYELECLLKETQALETAKKRLECAISEMQGPLKVGLTQLLTSRLCG